MASMTKEQVEQKLAQWSLANWEIDEAALEHGVLIFSKPRAKVSWDSIGAFWGCFNATYMEIFGSTDDDKDDVIVVEIHPAPL